MPLPTLNYTKFYIVHTKKNYEQMSKYDLLVYTTKNIFSYINTIKYYGCLLPILLFYGKVIYITSFLATYITL